MGHRIAEAAIEIDAPIERVWEAMTDLGAYAEWNPFIVAVKLDPDRVAVGTWMFLDVRWSSGGKVTSREQISRLDSPAGQDLKKAYFDYTYGGILPKLGLVRAVRTQSLEQSRGKPTHYETRIEFRGLLTMFVPVKNVQDGFERQAKALKERAEALAKRSGG